MESEMFLTFVQTADVMGDKKEKKIQSPLNFFLCNNNYKKKTLRTYNIHYIYTVFSNGHCVAT